MTKQKLFKPAPKPFHPEDNPVPVPQRTLKSTRQMLREMLCRIEGFLIGGLLVGLLLFANGLQRGEGQALTWCSVKFAERDKQYQDMSNQEFVQFERQAGRAGR
jgi:hypothetical protein